MRSDGERRRFHPQTRSCELKHPATPRGVFTRKPRGEKSTERKLNARIRRVPSGNSTRFTWFAQSCSRNETSKSPPPSTFPLRDVRQTPSASLRCQGGLPSCPFRRRRAAVSGSLNCSGDGLCLPSSPLPNTTTTTSALRACFLSLSLSVFSCSASCQTSLLYTPRPTPTPLFPSLPCTSLLSLKSNSLATSCGVSTRKGRQPPCGATATRCNIRQPVQLPTLLTRNSREEVVVLPVKGGIADDVRDRKKEQRG